ncbi:MAG TPA: hypothetical protein VE914_17605 [Candidatus Angelobacter sp.]|nr:hypothetical protein [Candidatus Angelobacter sp.]
MTADVVAFPKPPEIDQEALRRQTLRIINAVQLLAQKGHVQGIEAVAVAAEIILMQARPR